MTLAFWMSLEILEVSFELRMLRLLVTTQVNLVTNGLGFRLVLLLAGGPLQPRCSGGAKDAGGGGGRGEVPTRPRGRAAAALSLVQTVEHVPKITH